MDYRQYDNALGRFNSIDALAETAYSITPNHFGYNNPNYWSDPTGLISQAAIDAMWNNSANNASTTWINDGHGNFDSSSGNGWVNADSGNFNAYTDSLPEVTIYTRGPLLNGLIIQGHVYGNGKYYEHWRDERFSNQLNDMQSMFDAVGIIDPTGIVDGFNALGYLARGQKANARIAAMGIIPYIGDLGKGAKGIKGVTIIGEGMARVEAAAAKVPGATILNNMPVFSGKPHEITSQMMTFNRQWILQQMRSGKTIMDIGNDLSRANPSIFYQMEQNMLKNYQKLHPGTINVMK